MKKFILLLSLIAVSAQAKSYTVLLDGHAGQIRHGGIFSNAVFTPFEVELQVELAKHGVEVTQNENNAYTNALVTYSKKFVGKTSHDLNPRVTMSGQINFIKNKVMINKADFSIECGTKIRDGGNMTLKMSCVRKLARTIKEMLVAQDSEIAN